MTRRIAGQTALFATAPRRAPAAVSIEDAIRSAGIPPPEVEFHFAPPRRWAFDYAWPSQKIAFEIEGGGFGRLIQVTVGVEYRKGKQIPIKRGTRFRLGGRHNTGEGLQADAAKYNRAAILGWCVIRATTTMVRDGEAIRELEDAFAARGAA